VIHFCAKPSFKTDATIIYLSENQTLRSTVMTAALRRAIDKLRQTGQFTGKDKQLFPLMTEGNLILLTGVGKPDKLTSSGLRLVTRQALLSSYLSKAKSVEIIPLNHKESDLQAILEGILIGTYTWNKYKKPDPNQVEPQDKRITLITGESKRLKDVLTICEGVTLTRDLVNENADTTTAEYFEKTVRNLIHNQKAVSLKVLSRKELKAQGLNLHLAVNRGSAQEPKLIIVRYNRGPKSEKYTALIGKGITFDAGGINLKPSHHIETMRCDMSGAAAVMGILKNALALNIKRNLLFVMGMAENAIDAKSYKPGDIVKSYSGKTVEIANTDAEGRLVLADAISYTVKNYKPAQIIDLATLTGACIIALGYDYTGLISNNETLAKKLLKAAEITDDRAWQLPCFPELKDSVKSDVADIRNLGYPKGAAGTLTAAEFLRQFTQDTPWAHLDIAGTAFIEQRQHSYYSFGATGAGVRLITEFLREK